MTRAPNVPPGLVTLVSRLLAHDPEQRPRSARAVIRALETSMTLPRPQIRTLDMRPIAKRRSVRRSRLLSLKSALIVTTLSLIASLALHVDKQEVRVSGPRTAEAAIAEPTLTVRAEEVQAEAVQAEAVQAVTAAAAVPAPPAPAPSDKVARPHQPEKKRKARTEKRTRRAAVAKQPVATDEVAADEPTALDVATQYSDIGRRLKAMQEDQGDDSTFDLWPRYRLIRISEAMGSQRSRNETANILAKIEAAIDERSR
jgi:type IV secretory pathway VirB10-like protein